MLNMQYHGEISIGGQALRALFDTGSFDVMTLSTLCQGCISDFSPAALYNSSRSPTFAKQAGAMVEEFRFGSGGIRALQALDTVRFGGEEVTGMPFWQIIQHTMPFWVMQKGDPFSAIVGLCLPDKVPRGLSFELSSRDTLLDRAGVERFAFCLQPSGGADGWLTVDLPASAAEGPGFRRIPIVGEEHWAADLAAPRLGDRVLAGACSSGCVALVDTGSSLVLVPPEVMDALELALASTPRSPGDCSDVSGLPTLFFEIGGEEFQLPPEDYMVEDTTWGPMLASCRPAVQAVNRRTAGGADVWSLGLPFLRRHYTVFDRSGPALHIAAADTPCAGTATAAPAPAPAAPHRNGAAPLRIAENSTAPVLSASALRATSVRRPLKVDWRAARLPPWAEGDPDFIRL